MPEYQKNHIPINDSHFGTKKEFYKVETNTRPGRAVETPRTNASRSISPRAASFLLFWGIVAAALIIYLELSKADGIHRARTIGRETESKPSQKISETKNLAASQRAKKHPTPQKINSSIEKGKSSVSTPKLPAINTSGIWVGKWKIEGYLVNPLSPSEKDFKLSIEQKGSELTGAMAENGTKGTSGLIGNIEYINEKNQIAFEYKYSDGIVMAYTGSVNNQGNEAKGKWTSTGRYSGSWRMVKMKEPIQGAQQEASLPRSTNRSTAPEQAKKVQKEKITGREVTQRSLNEKDVKAFQTKPRKFARQHKRVKTAKISEHKVARVDRKHVKAIVEKERGDILWREAVVESDVRLGAGQGRSGTRVFSSPQNKRKNLSLKIIEDIPKQTVTSQASKSSPLKNETVISQKKPREKILPDGKSISVKKALQSKPLLMDTNQSMGTKQVKRTEKGKRTTGKISSRPHREETVKVLQKKAQELARQGKWAEAAKLAEQVVEKAPRSLKNRRFFGLYLLSASQYPKGIHELEKVLKDGHADVIIEHYLGHAYYKVGSYDKALNAFKRAVALDPANPKHYKCGARLIIETMGLMPDFSRNLTLAKTWYERALALGMRPDGLAGIKRMLEKNGRTSVNGDDNTFSSA